MAVATMHPRKQSKSERRNAVGEIRRDVGSSSAGPPSLIEIQRATEALNRLLRLSTDDRLMVAICEAPNVVGVIAVRPLSREELAEFATDWHEDEDQRVRKRRSTPAKAPPEAKAKTKT